MKSYYPAEPSESSLLVDGRMAISEFNFGQSGYQFDDFWSEVVALFAVEIHADCLKLIRWGVGHEFDQVNQHWAFYLRQLFKQVLGGFEMFVDASCEVLLKRRLR